MTKKIIKYYIILLVIFFSWVGVVSALEIKEVMYDPEGTDTNREWIKLYNDGSEIINIISGKTASAWRFSGGEKTETLHYINDTLNIGPGEYAIITSDKDTFIKEYPSFSGPVADTSMSLNNTGGIVKIWDGSNPRKVIASLEYNANDSTNANNTIDNITDNTVDETIDPIPLIKEDSAILKITTKIVSPKIVTAGIPFSLSSLTTTNRGETYAIGKFVWNFGDGRVREVGEANPFEYTYQYPGDYALTLSYYSSVFSTKPDATDKVTIKVVPAGINISSVGNASDPFVEIENKSSYEIILSKWVVTAGIHYFIIPEGTTLLSNKKIKLSPKITGFAGEDLNSIVISNGSKETIATYPIQVIKPIQKIASVNKTVNSNPVPADNSQDASLLKDPQVINLNDLGASAENTGTNISNSTYPIVGLLVVIGLGVASFLLIKKKRNVGDYVEQGISAKDMTIIE